MGLPDVNVMKLLEGSAKEVEKVQQQKEHVANVEKLSVKFRALELTAEEQQSQLDEMKKRDNENSDRHTKNIIEMRENIKHLKDNIAIS